MIRAKDWKDSDPELRTLNDEAVSVVQVELFALHSDYDTPVTKSSCFDFIAWYFYSSELDDDLIEEVEKIAQITQPS